MPRQIVLGPEAELIAGADQFIGVHGQIDVGSGRGIDAEELRRRDSDDGELDVVDQNRAAGRVGGSPEAPLTVLITEDGDGRCARAIVIGNDARGARISGRRRVRENSRPKQTRQFAVADSPRTAKFRLRSCQWIGSERTRSKTRDESYFREKLVGGEREDTACRSRLGIVVSGTADALYDGIATSFGAPVQHHQRPGILYRQGAHQDRIHEAVDRRVGAYAERQRRDGQRSEQAVGGHGPEGVAHVLGELLDHGQQRRSPGGTSVLLQQREVTQPGACSMTRLFFL